MLRMTLGAKAYLAGKALTTPLLNDPVGDEVIRRLDKEDSDDQFDAYMMSLGDGASPDDVELTDEELDELRRSSEEYED